jgi:hypothetical protein
MQKFKEIREVTFLNWLSALTRTREPGELSDNYSQSYICKWQKELTEKGEHCSVLCSIADWLDNVSDLLDDKRYDELSKNESEILFRYFTRILLIVSEIIEDFINLHANIKGIKKPEASRELERAISTLNNEELKSLSDFINSVCKHKSQGENYHIHNHHLKHEFEDFGDIEHENQISIKNIDWSKMDDKTTILFKPLLYYTNICVELNLAFDKLIGDEPSYKDKLFQLYSKKWEYPEGNS